MDFPTPLLKGVFLRRYKRFFADIRLDSGEEVVAHTPNTGAMRTCSDPDSEAYISRSDNPKRKLKFTWEIVRSGTSWVGVNTGLANRLAEEAVTLNRIPELSGYETVRREVRYGQNSRIDLLLEGGGNLPCYVEVKNVSMGREGIAAFPDAVSARATKHMGELSDQVRAGCRATVLFVVQRMDCEVFTPADDIDPTYGEALRKAIDTGVQALAWQADVSPEAITLTKALPIKL